MAFWLMGYKVTSPSAGVWHYEYALFNMNLDRGIQSFSVPLSAGVNVSNIGFHAPPQHPGWANDGTHGDAGYSSAPWTVTQAPDSITWNRKPLRRTKTRTRFAGAHCIISGSIAASTAARLPCHGRFLQNRFADDGCNPGPRQVGRQRQHLLSNVPPQLLRQQQLPRPRNGNTDCHSAADSNAKVHPVPKASSNSCAAPVAGDDGLVECVVLRKGAWLPRSFTLNALVNITAASPSDICAFGDYLSSSSEKTIHLLLIGAPQVFQKCFLLLSRAREKNYHLISASSTPTRRIRTMSKITLTGFALLSVLFFGNSWENYAAASATATAARAQSKQNASDASTGTLQKMIVENGSVTLNVDLNGLNGSNALVTRPAALQFAAATNSFFSILVFNDQLRGAESGSIALVPQGRPVSLLPSLLAASLKQLVVEKLPADSAFDMAVRDAKTGFTFFKIEGHQYDYDARGQLLDVQDGRLLMSKEFAAALGRPADANSAVGKISISARMQPIEVTQLINGEPKSMVMPALPMCRCPERPLVRTLS